MMPLERHHRDKRERRQAGQRAQLLRDTGLADPARDRDTDPDRPAGQQRYEDKFRGQLRRVQRGGGHRLAGAEGHDRHEDAE